MPEKKKENKESGKRRSAKREILEVVAAFVAAWVFYQVLILATGTPLPVVSVVSNSMLHEQGFEDWWDAAGGFYAGKGISKNEFQGFPTANGFSRGDLLFVVRQQPRIGDIIIYQRDAQSVVIVHRVVAVTENAYVTKGDNNRDPDPPVAGDAIFGKAVFAVPLLGYPRTLLHDVGI